MPGSPFYSETWASNLPQRTETPEPLTSTPPDEHNPLHNLPRIIAPMTGPHRRQNSISNSDMWEEAGRQDQQDPTYSRPPSRSMSLTPSPPTAFAGSPYSASPQFTPVRHGCLDHFRSSLEEKAGKVKDGFRAGVTSRARKTSDASQTVDQLLDQLERMESSDDELDTTLEKMSGAFDAQRAQRSLLAATAYSEHLDRLATRFPSREDKLKEISDNVRPRSERCYIQEEPEEYEDDSKTSLLNSLQSLKILLEDHPSVAPRPLQRSNSSRLRVASNKFRTAISRSRSPNARRGSFNASVSASTSSRSSPEGDIGIIKQIKEKLHELEGHIISVSQISDTEAAGDDLYKFLEKLRRTCTELELGEDAQGQINAATTYLARLQMESRWSGSMGRSETGGVSGI